MIGDSSQIFNNEWTIGEVGLNEIRLSLKTDHRDPFTKFHTDDQKIKLTHNNRGSLSSSEISKHSVGDNNMKYTKSTSPYSSTNSLNSIDLADLSNNSRANQHHPPVAPARKKRMAPRPPSQNSIPENQSTSSTTTITNNRDNNRNVFKVPTIPVIPRKMFHESSPNLANPNDLTKAVTTSSYKEFNNNNMSSLDTQYTYSENKNDTVTIRPTSQMFNKLNGAAVNNVQNRKTYTGGETKQHHSATSSDTEELLEEKDIPPEPTPRKRPAFSKFYLLKSYIK